MGFARHLGVLTGLHTMGWSCALCPRSQAVTQVTASVRSGRGHTEASGSLAGGVGAHDFGLPRVRSRVYDSMPYLEAMLLARRIGGSRSRREREGAWIMAIGIVGFQASSGGAGRDHSDESLAAHSPGRPHLGGDGSEHLGHRPQALGRPSRGSRSAGGRFGLASPRAMSSARLRRTIWSG
jgi:hypothetical protein